MFHLKVLEGCQNQRKRGREGGRRERKKRKKRGKEGMEGRRKKRKKGRKEGRERKEGGKQAITPTPTPLSLPDRRPCLEAVSTKNFEELKVRLSWALISSLNFFFSHLSLFSFE